MPPVPVVIPAGETVSPAFTIIATAVTQQTKVMISAAFNGVTQQVTLTVQ